MGDYLLLSNAYNYIRSGLELLYFLSGVILIVTVWIGLKQLKIVSEDFKIKNKRASVEKSIEYLNWFATDFIPQTNLFFRKVASEDLQYYKGPFSDQFLFDVNCKRESKYITAYITFCNENEAMDLLNQLEYFSAALISGLADEELAFNPLGLIYCELVERMYPFYCNVRRNRNEDDDRSSMFSYTIKLYNIWRKRIDRTKMERKRSILDESISKMPEERIKYIGGK
jgi:hypothetical protein